LGFGQTSHTRSGRSLGCHQDTGRGRHPCLPAEDSSPTSNLQGPGTACTFPWFSLDIGAHRTGRGAGDTIPSGVVPVLTSVGLNPREVPFFHTRRADGRKSSGFSWKQASVTLTPGVYLHRRYESGSRQASQQVSPSMLLLISMMVVAVAERTSATVIGAQVPAHIPHSAGLLARIPSHSGWSRGTHQVGLATEPRFHTVPVGR
jgi:hypothetical protein